MEEEEEEEEDKDRDAQPASQSCVSLCPGWQRPAQSQKVTRSTRGGMDQGVLQSAPGTGEMRDGLDGRWQMAAGDPGQARRGAGRAGGLVGRAVGRRGGKQTMRTIIACCNLRRVRDKASHHSFLAAHPYSSCRINRIKS